MGEGLKRSRYKLRTNVLICDLKIDEIGTLEKVSSKVYHAKVTKVSTNGSGELYDVK